jgi:hypothetical protein
MAREVASAPVALRLKTNSAGLLSLLSRSVGLLRGPLVRTTRPQRGCRAWHLACLPFSLLPHA